MKVSEVLLHSLENVFMHKSLQIPDVAVKQQCNLAESMPTFLISEVVLSESDFESVPCRKHCQNLS